MISFSPGKWIGLDTLGEDALNALRAPSELAVDRAAQHFESSVKETLGPGGGPRTGRLYRVSKKGPLHQASAPGEPPAVLFGKLRQSITHTRPQWTGWVVWSEVGTKLVYAHRMEWGGVDKRGVRILPRPYFEITALREGARLEHILEGSVRS